VNTPRVMALGTFVEDCLPFIDRAELNGIIPHFSRIAFDARLLDRGTLRRGIRGFLFGPLLFRRLCPNRHRSIFGIGGGRQLGLVHFGQVRGVGTDIALNVARSIDFEGKSTIRTERPSHSGNIRPK
jgi:hypothetical protein